MEKPPHRILVRSLIALGAVLTALAIFAVWTERQVLNTDEWVETSSELLEDEEIQAALNAYLVEELFANVDVQAELEQRLPPPAQPLAGPLAGALRQFAGEVAGRALAAPRVQAAWAEANRAAHQSLINLVEGDGRLAEAAGGAVTLDLQDIVAELAARVGISADIAAKLPEDVAQLEIIQTDQVEAAQTVGAAIRGLAVLFSVLALGSLALAVYLSSGRRRSTVLWAGLALIAAGIFVYALRNVAGDALVDALVKLESSRPAAEASWTISTSLLTSIATTVIVFGALFVLASWLASPRPSAMMARGALAPTLERHSTWAYGVVVTAALVYFALAPTHGLRALLTVGLLLALALAGVAALRRQAAEEFPDAQPGSAMRAIRAWGTGRRSRRAAPAGPAQAEDARLAQLERLGRLREQGTLSAEELAAEKARILTP
jgi:uncharacterized membrane protein YqjE